MPEHAPDGDDLTEGERWTREHLALLRDARFGPAAIAQFLVASQRRANAVKAERPKLARQAKAWIALGALAYVARPARRLTTDLTWWSATAVMLDWHLGMLETQDGTPRPLGPADALTLTRAWLVPVAASDPSPLVCVVAGATDALDGRLARATAPTRAGRDLEGLVDFCFAIAALGALARRGRIARPAVALEAARTTAGFAYALTAYFGGAERPDDALLHAARATTVVRVAGIVAAAAGQRRLGSVLLGAGSALSVLSAAASRGGSRAPAASP